MRKIILLSFLLMLSTPLLAEKPVFYFFHSASCPHCIAAVPFVDELVKKYPQIEFRKLEIGSNLENRLAYTKKIEELKIDHSAVPLFSIGKEYVLGFNESFKKKIEDMILRNIKKNQ